jgi:hypothetical protein
METHIQSTIITNQQTKSRVSTINLTPLWAALEFNRFGATPVFLTIAVCLGGIAAAVVLPVSILMLGIVGGTTALLLSTLIAIVPMRITFWLFILCLLVDLFVFIAYKH